VTAVIDAPAAVVMVTADGETRAADTSGRDSLKAREQAKADAAAARDTRAAEIHAPIGDMGRQLGFAWACTHTEPAEAYGAEPVMCEASGWDKPEYDAHMRGHGAKSITGVKLPRLRKRPPAASLPKLEVSPFKFITWAEDHTEPGICECGHTSSDHHYWHTSSLDAQRHGGAWKCGECDCIPAGPVKTVSQTAERRGQ
jgi:hypothetical protein